MRSADAQSPPARPADDVAFGRMPLNALRVFEAVARHGSLAAAAQTLHVQPSAVSMQLKTLQDHLGVALTHKAGRGIALTAEGERLAQDIAAGLAHIENALAALRLSTRREAVTLAVLPSFVISWLLPRLAQLERDCPEVDLLLQSTQQPVALGRHGRQGCAVRLGPGRWPDTRAEKLAEEQLLPVCTPAQLARGGPLSPGRWPERHTLIHNLADPWTLWAEAPSPAPRRHVVLDDATAAVAAAEAGLGLALVRASVARPALLRGGLVSAGPPLAYRYAFYFVTPRGVPDSPPVAALRRWFRREMAAGF
jgi:LysR family transcriptional regulator, glycine cleavage system transcriptional activator